MPFEGITALMRGVNEGRMCVHVVRDVDRAGLFWPLDAAEGKSAAKGRKTLRDLIGDWSYLRFLHQRKVTVRGASGRIWVLHTGGVHTVVCRNGHHLRVCQSNTGSAEGVPGEDKIAFAVLYLRNGEGGERELVEKGGTDFQSPKCEDCAEVLGRKAKVADAVAARAEWPPFMVIPEMEERARRFSRDCERHVDDMMSYLMRAQRFRCWEGPRQ